jgi:hypothetical protein
MTSLLITSRVTLEPCGEMHTLSPSDGKEEKPCIKLGFGTKKTTGTPS